MNHQLIIQKQIDIEKEKNRPDKFLINYLKKLKKQLQGPEINGFYRVLDEEDNHQYAYYHKHLDAFYDIYGNRVNVMEWYDNPIGSDFKPFDFRNSQTFPPEEKEYEVFGIEHDIELDGYLIGIWKNKLERFVERDGCTIEVIAWRECK